MNTKSEKDTAPRDWRSRLAGFGPLGALAFLILLAGSVTIAPVGAVLVLIWARLARIPYSNLGFVRPQSWISGVVAGIVLGVTLKLVMKAAVLPLLGLDAVNERFHFLVGNTQAAIGLAVYAIVGAGFGEETFFRGYLFERISAWLGRNWVGAAAAVVLSAALFGILHFQQGALGVINATIVGAVIGVVYLLNRRRLWTLMIAHASFDLVSLAINYFDLEKQVGTLIFH